MSDASIPLKDSFIVTFPCFTLLSDNCKGGVMIPLEDGEMAFLLLTDEDLLDRFRKDYGKIGPLIRFDFAFQLFYYLKTLPPRVTRVAFNPGKSAVTTQPLASFMKVLREAAEGT